MFRHDLRYAVRMLRKSPGFTAVAVLTLALGIGANTAVFTVLNAVMLRSLPVKDPERLVFLSDPNRHGVNGGQETGDRRLFAYHEFEWLRDHNNFFADIFAAESALSTHPITVEGADQHGANDHARISMVSGTYFSAMAVKAVVGRTFTAEVDKLRDANPVAVISYRYWKNRFAHDPAIVGRRIRVRQTSLEIIGVAQPGFSGETVGEAPDMWVPLTMQGAVNPGVDVLTPPKDVTNKYMWLQVMARLKPGMTLEAAQAGANLTLQEVLRDEASRVSAVARPGFLAQRIKLVTGSRGASTLRNSFGKPLLILMGLVGLVLLIACANVGNLLLARAATRQKEIAVRLALGAGLRRLLQQLLTESLVLALLGGGLGLLLAQWGDVVLVRLVSSESTPLPLDLRPDARMLGFTLAVSLLTGTLFGIVPAWRIRRTDLHSVLKGGAKGSVKAAPGGRGAATAGKALVVGQVAMSFLLLAAAGLFLRSFQKLTAVDPGYDSDHLLQFAMSPRAEDHTAPLNELEKQLLERIRGIPGVRDASLSLTGLLTGMNIGMNLSIDGYTPAPGEQMGAMMDYVGPGYFSTLGTPLLLGREVGRQDEGNAPLVAVINQSMARTYFGEANPLGRQIRATAAFGTFDFAVVGVVADSKHDDLRTQTGSWFYTPFFHSTRDRNFSWAMNTVRISGNGEPVAAAIRAVVKETAPLMATPEIQTIKGLVRKSLTTERMIMQLSGFFGVLALLLASIGLYGVMSYNVACRTNEIGIRMALGAQANDIARLMARQGMTLVAIGAVIGLSAAIALTRMISSLLYGVSATDVTTFAVITLLLAGVALFACGIPARRAARVDPMIALRCE
jgi:putative ABC transport system permease protein